MKKLIFLMLISFLFANTSIAETKKATLINDYGEKVIVAVNSQDAQDYFALGFYLYNEEILGAVAFTPALFKTNLASKITDSDTSMTLVTGTTRDGTVLSGDYCFTIDGNISTVEFVCGTASGTVITDLERGLGSDGKTEYADLKFSHRYGAEVKITDFPVLQRISNIFNGDATIPEYLTYDSSLTIVPTDSGKTLVSKEYIDGLVLSGVATSTEDLMGASQLATQLEMASSTYDVNNPAVLYAKYSTSSPDVAGHYAVITESDGKINQDFLDLTEDFTFASTTFSASTTWDVLPEYDSDPIGDDEAVRKSYVDQTTKKLEIDTTGVTFGDTLTETTIAQVTIPGGILSTNNAIRIKVLVSDFDIDADSIFTFAMKYDDTTIFSKNMSDSTTILLTDLGGYMEFYLVSDTATSSQIGFGTTQFFNNTIDNDNIEKVTGTGSGTSSENSDNDLVLTITGKYSQVDSDDSFTSLGYIMEIIK